MIIHTNTIIYIFQLTVDFKGTLLNIKLIPLINTQGVLTGTLDQGNVDNSPINHTQCLVAY